MKKSIYKFFILVLILCVIIITYCGFSWIWSLDTDSFLGKLSSTAAMVFLIAGIGALILEEKEKKKDGE